MFKKIIGATLLSLLSVSAMAGIIYNGHEYSLTTVTGSWSAAESEAIAAGGHLVAINDLAEQNFLTGAFGGSDLLWIGLNDAATEGDFVWSNGEAVTFTNWNAGEPNNLGNEDYTVTNWGGGGRWNDCPLAGCGGHRGIIEIANVPEPATTALFGLGLLGMSLRGRKVR